MKFVEKTKPEEPKVILKRWWESEDGYAIEEYLRTIENTRFYRAYYKSRLLSKLLLIKDKMGNMRKDSKHDSFKSAFNFCKEHEQKRFLEVI